MATFAGNSIGNLPTMGTGTYVLRNFSGYYIGGGEVSDATAPVLAITVPTISTAPLLITITEASLVLRITECLVRIGTGSRIVAYDEVEGFLPPYNGRSSIVGTGTVLDPLVITLYRFGNWPTGIPIDAKIKAVDYAGNKVIG